jgi:hypothetical protein
MAYCDPKPILPFAHSLAILDFKSITWEAKLLPFSLLRDAKPSQLMRQYR